MTRFVELLFYGPATQTSDLTVESNLILIIAKDQGCRGFPQKEKKSGVGDCVIKDKTQLACSSQLPISSCVSESQSINDSWLLKLFVSSHIK